MKKIVATLLGLFTLASLQAEDLPLRIYSGAPDTIYSSKTTLVAVTSPGATASINGESVHVFRTGSFGKELQLTPGENSFAVSAEKGDLHASKEIKIYYSTSSKANRGTEASTEPERIFPRPILVRTGDGAFLQYGAADDRLGGSKMGFIDSDIVLESTAETPDLYRVRLGEGRDAYLPKEHATQIFDVAFPEVVETGSWSVADTGDSDRVTISLPRRLAYQYATDIDPQTISVDIFGARDNSNWITQRTASLGIIDYVDFRQVASDIYRVIIRLKGNSQWGFHVGYGENGSALTIDVRHQPKSLKLKNLTIGLDAGHGGEYPGAVSPSGLKEKDVNLDIVHHLQRMLESKGAKVVMTRQGDTGPSMAERKRIWRDAKVDLAISVHNNSGGSALSSPGTAVLYKHLFCRPLAQAVTKRMLETGLPLFGIVQNFNFSLNGPTEFPEVLVEGMFMSSLEEEEKLADPAFRELVARKILAAIEDYLAEVAK